MSQRRGEDEEEGQRPVEVRSGSEQTEGGGDDVGPNGHSDWRRPSVLVVGRGPGFGPLEGVGVARYTAPSSLTVNEIRTG